MKELSKLLLLSGNDVPFVSAHCSIHQPKLNEIAYMGEGSFHKASHFLIFDKSDLSNEDKTGLENQSNFNIFMSVLNEPSMNKKADISNILTLMFPDMEVEITERKIILQTENFESAIEEKNFDDFQDIVRQIFCLGSKDSEQYNPADALAKKIAEKLKKKPKAQSEAEEDKEISIYSRYVSILSVGLKKDMNELLQYTVYQLNDEFERFRLKNNFDMLMKAKLAGASDTEELKNWMEDIHS